MYEVEWTEKALKTLKKIDKLIAEKIKNKVDKELAKDPYSEGEPLKGNLKGKWSFHYASYRIIYEVFKDRLLAHIYNFSPNRLNHHSWQKSVGKDSKKKKKAKKPLKIPSPIIVDYQTKKLAPKSAITQWLIGFLTIISLISGSYLYSILFELDETSLNKMTKKSSEFRN